MFSFVVSINYIPIGKKHDLSQIKISNVMSVIGKVNENLSNQHLKYRELFKKQKKIKNGLKEVKNNQSLNYHKSLSNKNLYLNQQMVFGMGENSSMYTKQKQTFSKPLLTSKSPWNGC